MGKAIISSDLRIKIRPDSQLESDLILALGNKISREGKLNYRFRNTKRYGWTLDLW